MIEGLHQNEWDNFNSIWDAIKNDPPKSILDIGCGCAIYDALLAHQGIKKFFLIDGDGSRYPRKKYGPIDRPWGNVNMGVAFMKQHAPDAVVTAYELNSLEQVFAMNSKFVLHVDLILSIRSWCHHYPAETYARMARRCLDLSQGRMIVDIRKGTDNFDVLVRHGFKPYMQLPAHSFKCDRWMFR
jgi:hypothetical protein